MVSLCERSKNGRTINCVGGQSPHAAKQIAARLDRIPHKVYVDPFLGVGNVWRAREVNAPTEVLNDLECKRVKNSKVRACLHGSDTEKCRAFKAAKVSCRRDYGPFLKTYDAPGTLIYLDPPYHDKSGSQRNYGKTGLDFPRFVGSVRRIKRASVAISYSNNPEFKREFCGKTGGFKCHRINKNFLGKRYVEILAVRTKGGGGATYRGSEPLPNDISLVIS
jgi:site-specific DNA-adenine methylase